MMWKVAQQKNSFPYGTEIRPNEKYVSVLYGKSIGIKPHFRMIRKDNPSKKHVSVSYGKLLCRKTDFRMVRKTVLSWNAFP